MGNMCADVSNGTCEAAVKERNVKDVFDLVCDDRKWDAIQKEIGHHGPQHAYHFNPVILYVCKARAAQYMKKWFPDDPSWGDYGNYDDKQEHQALQEAHEEFSKLRFHTQFSHHGQKS